VLDEEIMDEWSISLQCLFGKPSILALMAFEKLLQHGDGRRLA